MEEKEKGGGDYNLKTVAHQTFFAFLPLQLHYDIIWLIFYN